MAYHLCISDQTKCKMINIIEVPIMALVRYTRPNYQHLSKSFNELMDEFFEPMNVHNYTHLPLRLTFMKVSGFRIPFRISGNS